MAAAHIDHPNVAAATDFGKLDDGSFFLVLEYVEGAASARRLTQGRARARARAPHRAARSRARSGARTRSASCTATSKPENVMLVTRDGDPDFVKVLDFGIAKVPVGTLAASASGDPRRARR